MGLQFFARKIAGFCRFLGVALVIFCSFGGIVRFFIAEGSKKVLRKLGGAKSACKIKLLAYKSRLWAMGFLAVFRHFYQKDE